jgi:hypothetical protein
MLRISTQSRDLPSCLDRPSAASHISPARNNQCGEGSRDEVAFAPASLMLRIRKVITIQEHPTVAPGVTPRTIWRFPPETAFAWISHVRKFAEPVPRCCDLVPHAVFLTIRDPFLE